MDGQMFTRSRKEEGFMVGPHAINKLFKELAFEVVITYQTNVYIRKSYNLHLPLLQKAAKLSLKSGRPTRRGFNFSPGQATFSP